MTLPAPPVLLCAAYAPPSADASPESQTLNLKPTRFRIIRCENPPVEAQLLSKSRIAQRYRSILSWSRITRRCTCALGIALSTEDFLSKCCVDINIGITAPVATPKRINNQTTP